ncbi:DNA polymerase zeta catalytic subunit, partial [Brachionus plicatilis]
MKLNLYGFDGKLSEIALNEHGSNEEDLQWFTPALPLPSVRRVQRKISKKESSLKLKKLKKASQLSQTLKVNKTSSQSSTSSQDQIETSSIQSNSQLGIQIPFNLTPFKKNQFESKSILVKKDTPKIKSEKKRKSVRFSEKTLLVNEKITQNEFAESNEKSHFTVEGILKDQTLNNIKMNCSIPSTPYSSIVDDFASSNSFNSNTTLVLDEENPTQNQEFNHSINQTLDTTIKPSFYEFDSILFPKASKYVDYLSMTTQDLSNDENVSSKESKKEKKILNKNKENSLNLTENFHLTIMSMEAHVKTRGDLTPDPEHDSIGFISFTILHNRPIVEIEENSYDTHLIIFDWEKRSMATTRYLGLESTLKKQIKSITYTYSEEDLVESFVRAVQFFDPDILVGFEIQKLSWCYVARRAIKLKILDFCSKISRLPKFKRESLMRINLAKKPSATTSRLVESNSEVMPVPHELIIAGRVVLNLWRILRSEIALSMYSLENCCFSILHERVPRYSYSTLDKWFQHRTDLFR